MPSRPSALARIFRRLVGRAADRAADTVSEAVEGLILPTEFQHAEPGSTPGIEVEELRKLSSAPAEERVRISCIDYSPDQVQIQEDIQDTQAFLAQHRPEWTAVRWINVDGLSDLGVIEALATKYRLHPLAIEDLLLVPQRPKVEAYSGTGEHQARLFIIARMIYLEERRLQSEQISIFLGHNTVLTFQERPGFDVWGPIRQRMRTKGSRIRTSDASFLAYSLIDAIVDHCFPILEHYGTLLEDLEDKVLERPGPWALHEIHRLKRELLLLRRAIWPMREVVNQLQRDPHECLSDNTRTYLRDVYDHTVQIIDILETYREVGTALTETYMTYISNRLNEIMKVLTMISAVFIPITFLSGVFGMNFEVFPWKWPHAFPVFVGSCLLITAGMLVWFRRRGWL